MSITLSWANPNTSFDEVQIFRSETRFPLDVIPTGPVKIVTDGSTTYVDNDTVQNKYYYYIVAVKTGNDIVYAPQSVAINMPYTGPGPTTVRTGTWERGFFGVLNTSEFVSAQEIREVVGIGTANAATTNLWGKFILNGKILFIPFLYVLSTVGWNSLYLAGCVYGMDTVGPATGHGQTPTLQNKKLSKGDHDYRIRLPRGCASADYSFTGIKELDSEWFQAVQCMFNQKQVSPANDLADYTPGTYWISSQTMPLAEFAGLNAFCQIGAVPSTLAQPTSAALRSSINQVCRLILELVL